MAVTLTGNARAALAQVAKEPNIVLQIEGVDRIFGAQIVRKYVRFGDGSEIGDPTSNDEAFYIGGMNAVEDQDNLITLDGTSTSIRQTLDPFAGQGASISMLSIAMMDTGYVTELLTPGLIVDDIMQRKCVVYYGFNGTAWPDDYVVAFRGSVVDVVSDPGKSVFQLNAPEEKKRTNIFKKVTTKLLGAMDSSSTVVALESTTDFLVPIAGPAGVDGAFKSYVRIDDEIIRFTGTQDEFNFPVTISIASPGVVSSLGHGRPANAPVVFTTTGALPTGLTAGTTYYVKSPTLSTFTLSATPGGSAINTSGTQSGVHTMYSPPLLTGVTRAQIDTTAASHAVDVEVNTFYTLEGNATEIALKLMLSGNVSGGISAPFVENVKVDAINLAPDGTRVDNSLFFYSVNVAEKYGISSGDYIYSLQASFPNNGITMSQITEIVRGETGDFVVISDTLQDTTDDTITAKFISQYATLPDGCRMTPDEVDVEEHQRLKRLFLSSTDLEFYIKDGIEDARKFIEQEIYMPIAAYSLPRKARASMGYHIGPIPGVDIVSFDESGIRNASKMTVRRSTNKNFYNEVVYQYDEDALEDKFKTGYISISEDSKTRIKNSPNRTLKIKAKGMRTFHEAAVIAQTGSARRLNRYQYGAEVFSFDVMLDSAFGVEIGDICMLDASALNLPDSKSGKKGMKPRLLEIQNKDFQLKTGLIRIEAVDTGFDGASRYGLISPASRIKAGISSTEFIIEASFSSRFGQSEFRKWNRFKRPSVRIRNDDFSVNVDTVILSADSNRIVVEDMGLTPAGGYTMELTDYGDVDTTDQIKLIYAFMSDTDFADGKTQYRML